MTRHPIATLMPAAPLLVLLLAGGAHGQDLVTNGGFESVVVLPDVTIQVGWFNGPAYSSSEAFAHSGDRSVALTDHAPLLGGIFQDIQLTPDLTPGTTLILRGFAYYESTNPLATSDDSASMGVEFFDANDDSVGPGGEVLFFDWALGGNTPDAWLERELEIVIPENATSLSVGLFLNHDQFSGDGVVYFDDVSLRPVPAPGTAALLGLGALTATRRRRLAA